MWTAKRARSPQLNGKVERSHRSDQEEFYQLLTTTDDVDLNATLAEWERFYNLHRPHGAFAGNTPYEDMTLPGRVTATVLRGRITARDGAVYPRTDGK